MTTRREPATRPAGGRSSLGGSRQSSRPATRPSTRATRAGDRSTGPTTEARGKWSAGGVRVADPDTGSPGPTWSTTRVAVLATVLVVLAVSYAYPLRAFFNQRSELAEERVRTEQLQAQIADLTSANELWQDPAYVRAQARERLGFTLPGEVALVVVGDEPVEVTSEVSGPVVPAISLDNPWWERLWGGVEMAGNPAPGDTDATAP